ncbi:MAG: hypothetical protein WCK47_02875 [bacterium]|nr:hypothetical protein [Candidatus Sumerlaeota bacterium]
MKRKRIITSIAALLLLVIAGVLLYLVMPGDRKQIQHNVKQMALLCETENVAQLGDHISPDYRGEIGSDKTAALEIARSAFARVDDLRVKIESVETKIHDAKARVFIIYSSSGRADLGEFGNNVPFRNIRSGNPLRPETIYAEFTKKDGKWLTDYASWDTVSRLDEFPASQKQLGN